HGKRELRRHKEKVKRQHARNRSKDPRPASKLRCRQQHAEQKDGYEISLSQTRPLHECGEGRADRHDACTPGIRFPVKRGLAKRTAVMAIWLSNASNDVDVDLAAFAKKLFEER